MFKILLLMFYVLIACTIALGIAFSLGMKQYSNAILIVTSLSVFFLGRHLHKNDK